jgi:hypothetical protein
VRTIIRLLALSALLGFATAGLIRPTSAVADSAGPPGCGVTAADPKPGYEPYGYVAVVQGDALCTVAMAVIDRYFHDPTLEHNGNSWSAYVDGGWSCRMPNAMARQYGWRMQCTRGSGLDPTDEVQIRFMPDDIGPPPQS